jgi:hypothetical protein
MAHCTATCASFTVGTSQVTDTSGNTLGCRIYYARAPSMMEAATHCAHAGPGGDLITATPPAFAAVVMSARASAPSKSKLAVRWMLPCPGIPGTIPIIPFTSTGTWPAA